MREPVLPNFFIVGTGKAGTTSLYYYLRQHSQIYMSPVKEPCYFASEIRIENLTAAQRRHTQWTSGLVSQWDDYLALFQGAQGKTAIGEASVAYLWSATAATNIAARIPDSKIIMILRDPAERAFSQYLHQLTEGLICCTFREHIRKCMRNRERKLGVYYPLLEVGLYSEQIKRYLNLFPRNNIRIYWYEEAWKDVRLFLQDLFAFLNVDPTFLVDTSRKRLQRRAPRFTVINYAIKQFPITHQVRKSSPFWLRSTARTLLFRSDSGLRMTSADRKYLVDYYREDIRNLASLLDRDLSVWLA